MLLVGHMEKMPVPAPRLELIHKPVEHHFARTRLVCVENTHNRSGGRIFPIERIHEIAAFAKEAGLRLHLDGARIFNAEVATGVPVEEWGRPFDSISAHCVLREMHGLRRPATSTP